MSAETPFVPDRLPILSRGKHRSPRRGACFMELASYLAGERWSDHPRCTHPLIASVARHVNDYTSDEARPRLAVLIPSVIGLAGDDPHIDVRVALRCARTALPVVRPQRQRVMAAAIFACESALDDLDGLPPGSLEARSRAVLDQAPEAERWARRFTGQVTPSARGFRRHAAPSIVSQALPAIAEAAPPRVDDLLHDLLAGVIDDARSCLQRDRSATRTVAAAEWDAACRVSGARTAG